MRAEIKEMDVCDKVIRADILSRSKSSERFISHKQRPMLFLTLNYLKKVEDGEIDGVNKYVTLKRIEEYVRPEMVKLVDATVDKVIEKYGKINPEKIREDGNGFMIRKVTKEERFEKVYNVKDSLKFLITCCDGIFLTIKEIGSESAKKLAGNTFYKIRIHKRGLELLRRWEEYIFKRNG